jgi:KAP family P-loop domain
MSDKSSLPVENIASLEDFEAWMRQLSPYHKLHVPPVIAVRCALRAIPFVADDLQDYAGVRNPSLRRSKALGTIRTTFTARTAWLHPNRALANACLTAGTASHSDAREYLDTSGRFNTVSAASEAAFCVAEFVTAFDLNSVNPEPSRYAVNALDAALLTALHDGGPQGQTDIWRAVDEDRRQMDSGDASAAFMNMPLWPDGVPDWWNRLAVSFHDTLAGIKDGEADTSNWSLWSTWLQDCVSGAPAWGLSAEQAGLLEQRIALGDDRMDFWVREPGEIVGDIARMITEASSPVEKAADFGANQAPSKNLRKSTPKPAIKGSLNVAEEDDKLQATATLSPASDTDSAQSTAPPPPAHRADLEPLSDAVDPSVDYLDRADIAFALAGRLNEVWDQMNPADAPDEAGDSALWTGRFHKKHRPSAPGFVVHIDAPWGGGKTTFAEYLAQILNPYSSEGLKPGWLRTLPLGDEKSWPQNFRRPWHIVRFNAWQHQHVSPPWWVFYETMRQTCVRQSASETNLRQADELPPPVAEFGFNRPELSWITQGRHWLAERLWRLWTPSLWVGVSASMVTIFLVFLLWKAGMIDASKPGEINYGAMAKQLGGVTALGLAVLLGGGASIRNLFAAFASSLIPGTPDAAKNFSQGADDPLKRMRRHFVDLMERIHRPVLVIVDDLDRCDPAFVVELVRGMQTILTSPRIVYLLLGDRDWIEQSFTEVHKAMKSIEVGPEHRFGGRFVEKAIQFSMVLPAIAEGDRREYVQRLLFPGEPPHAPAAATEAPDVLADVNVAEYHKVAVSKLRAQTEAVLSMENYEERERMAAQLAKGMEKQSLGVPKQEFDRQMARKLFYRAAADKTAAEGTSHMIEGLVPVLPANPRQIKRIINTLSLLQQVLRIRDPEKRPGSRDWQALARWVVLMVEWPMSWFTLTRHPALADLAIACAKRFPDEEIGKVIAMGQESGDLPNDGGLALARMIAANKTVMQILTFHAPEWPARNITRTEIEWLREIMPAASGQMLSAAAAARPEAAAQAKAGTLAPAPSKLTPRSPPASPAA